MMTLSSDASQVEINPPISHGGSGALLGRASRRFDAFLVTASDKGLSSWTLAIKREIVKKQTAVTLGGCPK